MTKPKHPGGRPKLGVHRVDVTLTDENIAKARRVGYGKLSKGIRKTVEVYKEEK